MSHTFTSPCLSCVKIIYRYPAFHAPLKDWFFQLQLKHPEIHISCAGRGMAEQEALFTRGASRAHWKESAHNWSAALDLFFLIDGKYNLDLKRFETILCPELTPDLNWYGRPFAPYQERPHVELMEWNSMAKSHLLHLVE